MAIANFDNYIAARKQDIQYSKTIGVTSVANVTFSTHQTAGTPGAGVLPAAASVAAGGSGAGVVPIDTLAGYPLIDVNTGNYHLTKVVANNTVASNIIIYDRLWHVNMSLTALGTGTITAPPSYVGRLPNSSYVNGLFLFLEITTTVSASAVNVTVNYVNQNGVAGRTTGASGSLSGFTAARWVPMPLQAGDSGIQNISSIVVGGTAATAGAFNVVVARRLWKNRVKAANFLVSDGIDMTGSPELYPTSALGVGITADGASTGQPDLQIEISSL